MTIESDRPIILFDGVCGLCDKFVQFVMRHDPDGKVAFAALQSNAGKELLQKFGFQKEQRSFVVLIEGDKSYVKSTAVLRAVRHLPGSVRHFAMLSAVPRFISDAVYDFIASRRYHWFGKYDECIIPTPEERKRFLT